MASEWTLGFGTIRDSGESKWTLYQRGRIVARGTDEEDGRAILRAMKDQESGIKDRLADRLSELAALSELSLDYDPGTDLYTVGEVAKMVVEEARTGRPPALV